MRFCSADDWEWEDEGGSWVSYSVDVARRLEAGRICGLKSVEFSVGGREYKLEIEEMKQVNVETKMERNVRRNDAGSFTGEMREREKIKYRQTDRQMNGQTDDRTMQL